MTQPLTIALISGGISSERSVSCNSGDQVFEALNKTRYRVQRYDPQTDLGALVADAPQIDSALIILHGPYGEDGTVQGLLDLLGIPYQGAGVLGSALAMNKAVAKTLYRSAGLPVLPDILVRRGDSIHSEFICESVGLPAIVKPASGGSSIGMAIVGTPSELALAIDAALDHDPQVLVEQYAAGTEVTAAVLGNTDLEALPLIEIVPGAGHAFFDYTAKYTAGVTEEICPARLAPDLTAQAQDLAKRAHRVLQCRGYSRTDFLLTNGQFHVLETNTIPGMTATSLLPQAAAAAGYSFSALLDRLIELSLEAADERPAAPFRLAGPDTHSSPL